MSKKSWIIVGIIVVLIGAAIAYISLAPRQQDGTSNITPSTAVDTPATTESPDVSVPSEAPSPTPGAYVAYSQDAINNTKGEKIIFFHAPWCPQCRDLDKSITAGPIPNNVTIFKIDYDSNQALRKKYGVTMQTTFIKIDDQGNKINSYVAYDHPNLDAVVQHLIDIR